MFPGFAPLYHNTVVDEKLDAEKVKIDKIHDKSWLNTPITMDEFEKVCENLADDGNVSVHMVLNSNFLVNIITVHVSLTSSAYTETRIENEHGRVIINKMPKFRKSFRLKISKDCLENDSKRINNMFRSMGVGTLEIVFDNERGAGLLDEFIYHITYLITLNKLSIQYAPRNDDIRFMPELLAIKELEMFCPFDNFNECVGFIIQLAVAFKNAEIILIVRNRNVQQELIEKFNIPYRYGSLKFVSSDIKEAQFE